MTDITKKKMFVVCLVIFAIVFVGYKMINQGLSRSDKKQDETTETFEDIPSEEAEVIIFHNGTGQMCIDALNFLHQENIKYTEHLTDEIDFQKNLSSYKNQFSGTSEGYSDNFGYYPIIFINDKAFSGFDNGIGVHILDELNN